MSVCADVNSVRERERESVCSVSVTLAGCWNTRNMYISVFLMEWNCVGILRQLWPVADVVTLMNRISAARWMSYFIQVTQCLKYYAMKTFGVVNIQIHVLLTLPLVGSDWSASSRDRFTPRERAPPSPDIHWIRVCVGPKTGLDDMEKGILSHVDSNSYPSTVQSVASLYRLYHPGSWLLVLSK
jgi:hypothetical protein